MTNLKRSACILAVVVLIGAGIACYLSTRPVPIPVHSVTTVEREFISVFLADSQGKLEKKTVETPRGATERERADALLQALKEARSIPAGLRLYEMALGQDGVLYLNVSKEFLGAGSVAREVPMVYGIVDSFAASFPGVRSVQILVEGSPVYTRSGLLYLLKPLQFNKELLED